MHCVNEEKTRWPILIVHFKVDISDDVLILMCIPRQNHKRFTSNIIYIHAIIKIKTFQMYTVKTCLLLSRHFDLFLVKRLLITLMVVLFYYCPSKPCIHNTRTFKLRHLNGTEPLFILLLCVSYCGMSKCLLWKTEDERQQQGKQSETEGSRTACTFFLNYITYSWHI